MRPTCFWPQSWYYFYHLYSEGFRLKQTNKTTFIFISLLQKEVDLSKLNILISKFSTASNNESNTKYISLAVKFEKYHRDLSRMIRYLIIIGAGLEWGWPNAQTLQHGMGLA